MSVNEKMVEQSLSNDEAGNTTGTTPATEGKTFTQDDVNRIVQERLAKEREKASVKPDDAAASLAEREKALAQRELEITRRDSRGKTELLLAKHEFVNEITRNYFIDAVESALESPENKGKSREEIFTALTQTDGRPDPGIFRELNPNRLQGPPPAGNPPDRTDAATRQAMGLKP